MNQRQLQDALDKLRAEVRRIAVSHPEEKERLEQLLADLERAPSPGAGDPSLVSKAREAVAHFEAEHPTVTAILNDVLVSMGNVGM